jgi:hypothetical protein
MGGADLDWQTNGFVRARTIGCLHRSRDYRIELDEALGLVLRDDSLLPRNLPEGDRNHGGHRS